MRIPIVLCALLLLAAPALAVAPSWVHLPQQAIYLTSESGTNAPSQELCRGQGYSLGLDAPGPGAAAAVSADSSLAQSCTTIFSFRAPADLVMRTDPRLQITLQCSAPTIAVGVADLDITAATIGLRIGPTTFELAIQDVIACTPDGVSLVADFDAITPATPERFVPKHQTIAVTLQANWLSLFEPVPTVSIVTAEGASRITGFSLEVPDVRPVQTDAAGGAGPATRTVGQDVHFRIDAYGTGIQAYRIDHDGDGVVDEMGAGAPPAVYTFTATTAGVHRFLIEVDHIDPLGALGALRTSTGVSAYAVLADTGPKALPPSTDLADTDANGPGGISDGIPDALDNCPTVYNPGQEDFDRDGIGDACDIDKDGDNVEDTVYTDAAGSHGRLLDNCLLLPNPLQSDVDADGMGDACDTDADNDSIKDKVIVNGTFVALTLGQGGDNCPLASNANQADMDGDLVGDACDSDADGDGTPDALDVCPGQPNLDQSDLDGDGTGDVCDGDIDGDKMPNALDICPRRFDPQQKDADGDSIGDACDPDVDGDGRIDNLEAGVDQGPPAKRESLFGLDDKDVPGVAPIALLLGLVAIVLVRRR